MENNLKETRTKSDMVPWLSNFFKLAHEIGALKNEKINFSELFFLKILFSRYKLTIAKKIFLLAIFY